MSNVLVNDLYLNDIADAIRSKLNVQTTYKPSEMANAIESISGGGSSTPVINSLSVTENGTYTAPTGVDGYSPITVNVPSSSPSLGTKSITENGTYNASSDSLDGYSSVTVNVPQGSTPTGTKQISITQNGTTTEDVTSYASAEITVNVSGGSSTLEIPLKNLGWEVGAVDGGTGQQYQNKKLNNTARLRGIYLVSTANIPFNLSANWDNGEWTIMCAEYGADGKGRTQFTTVLTADGQLPIAPYLAFVIRHSDGTTAMNESDINTINPILTIDSSRLS